MASMQAGYESNQEMRPWISPSLIEANYILALSQLELQQVVAAEMEQNPALEMEDRPTCPVCGTLLDGNYCPVCLTDQHQPAAADSLETYDDFSSQLVTQVATRDDAGDFDPMAAIASDMPVLDQVLADARLVLDESEYPLAEYIVESLDEHGLLTIPPDDIASRFNAPLSEVQTVIDVIQDVAPVGVGARDLRECLLLQIDYLALTGHTIPAHVRDIVEDHLDAFGAHRFGQIASAFNTDLATVEQARDFIRESLSPYPLQSAEARSWRSPSDAAYVAPDVAITLKDDELRVEMIDSRYFHLRMNEMYANLAQEYRRSRTPKSPENGQSDSDEVEQSEQNDAREHVRHYTNRASFFMSNIQQRRETLLRISQCICELQESFLKEGVREIRPLTRATVAQQVGVHESTVSRATANKYVLLPSRKVIPFSDFFTASLGTKALIKELVDGALAKGESLTDRQICDLLLKQGVRIARRTVAKYRAELGILPSTLR